jgi:Ca-activated chloride channel family protein
MITFGIPWLLALLPLPWLVRHFIPAAKPAQSAALRVPFFGHLAARAGGITRGTPRNSWMRWIVLSLAWLLLVGSAARPQWLGPARVVPTEGRDLMLALDVSGSMAQDDFTASGRAVDRLSVVRAVADQFVADREGDRVGLVLFGSRAYLQAPPTADLDTVRDFLGEAEVGLAGKETAIGDAIGLAVKHLRNRPEGDRVLVLLSDGASNAGVLDPMLAADLAKKEGVRIHTIGVGADRMAVNTVFGTQIVDPSADLDEKTLAAIAEMTGGQSFRAKSTEGLVEVYREIDALEPTEGEELFVRPTKQLFYWPLGAAFALSALYAIGCILRPGSSAFAASSAWRTA